jgi:hypothetical protein
MKCTYVLCLFFLLSMVSKNAFTQECGVVEVWQQFRFLSGKWKVENSTLIEKWQLDGEDVLTGKAYSIASQDTILHELIQLIFDQNNIWYKAQVIGQNNDQSILFKLVKCQPNLFVFENAEHDYPQKIGYRRVGSDKMLVWIEGSKNGKHRKSEWAMRKSEEP